MAIASMVLLLVILSLPWRPWLVNEKWEAGNLKDNSPLRDITVLVPARNEEQVIHQTMSAVLNQGEGLSVVVINDHSSDGTAGILANFENRVTVINSPPLPAGWMGKFWALEQGRLKAETPLLPLTAGLFLGMTWTSAFRYWNGEQVRWRGRTKRKRPVEHMKGRNACL